MKKLPPLSLLQSRLSYDPETGFFDRIDLGRSNIGSVDSEGYLTIKIDGSNYKAHRLAWLFGTGDDPFPLTVDHKNRIVDDNRLSNLRLADQYLQSFNQKVYRSSVSGITGVSFVKRDQKWLARAQFKKKFFHLGLYDSKEEAIQARKAFDEEHRAGWKH